ARARETLCQRVRAQEHCRPDDLVIVRLTDATGVTSQQPELQLRRLLRRDRLRDEPAESSVDAVRVVTHLCLEERPRGGGALTSLCAEAGRATTYGDVPDIADLEALPGQLQSGRHGASLDARRPELGRRISGQIARSAPERSAASGRATHAVGLGPARMAGCVRPRAAGSPTATPRRRRRRPMGSTTPLMPRYG